MKDFNYYAPTNVVFGKDAEQKTGELIKELGYKRVLLHFGGQSAEKSGLLERITASLAGAGLSYVLLGGVLANPRVSKVYEGINLCKEEGVDFILAVGGGSVIDSAKAIAYGLANEGDVWDFYVGKREPKACYPLGAVLTLAATGSEMSNSSVISNEESKEKRGCNSDLSRCRFAIMNPELTYTLPPFQTACGVVDIMMHTMERYFTKDKDRALIDSLSEALLRTVMESGKQAFKDPFDYDARAQIMWSGSLSHNDLMGCRVFGDWACHQLEHELSAMFDVAHAAGLAAIWGSWARYVMKENISRFVQFAVNVMGCRNDFANPEKTALAGIEAMEDFYRSIAMPTSIRELGFELNEDQIAELAYRCSFYDKRTVGSFKVLDKQAMADIYRAAI